MTPEFADLVLLVNPAIEGARYHSDLRSRDQRRHLRPARRSSFPFSSARRQTTISRSGWCFRLAMPAMRIDEAPIGDLEKVVRHSRPRLRAELPHAYVERARRRTNPSSSTLPAGRSGQSVLGGWRRKGSDRRTRRDLAGAVPVVHREPCLPACAGFKEGVRGRSRRAALIGGRSVGRSGVLREIHWSDQNAAV